MAEFLFTSESVTEGVASLLSERIRVVPDFPRPGIAFQDLCPVFAVPGLLGDIAAAMADAAVNNCRFDRVLAVEARGFILGAAIALRSAAPLALARKEGKLPGPVHTASYELEYGQASLEIQQSAIKPGERILIVDDVLATGGTLAAAAALVAEAAATTAGHAVAVRISALSGERRLRPSPVFALLSV
jgi:adenine phosphoribosyltransferase